VLHVCFGYRVGSLHALQKAQQGGPSCLLGHFQHHGDISFTHSVSTFLHALQRIGVCYVPLCASLKFGFSGSDPRDNEPEDREIGHRKACDRCGNALRFDLLGDSLALLHFHAERYILHRAPEFEDGEEHHNDVRCGGGADGVHGGGVADFHGMGEQRES